MLIHYLKLAFRNMWKYKSQTLISLIGLAVGFTCFALAMLWIRYEMTYDSFHQNAKQLYVVYKPSFMNPTGYDRGTVNPLAAYLKETFPEIKEAITLLPAWPGLTYSVEGVDIPAKMIAADSSFFRRFDVKILEGNRDFMIPGNHTLAITQEKARRLFGDENPIGKTVSIMNNEFVICAIVSDMSKHSNYAFDFIWPFFPWSMDPNQHWNTSGGENTIIELYAGTNIEAFEKKLYDHTIDKQGNRIEKMTIKPLTKLRYLDSDIISNIKFHHVVIFAITGLLVIICSLFNYLNLFISRFRLRQKEMSLRVVCGATGGSLLKMFSVEFMVSQTLVVLSGCYLTQLIHKSFLSLSDIHINLSAIFIEALVYFGGIIIVSLFVFWLNLYVFRRRSLNLSINQGNKKQFRKIAVIGQLVISMGFAFVAIIILKQIYFLHHTDELGFSFQNRGVITFQPAGRGDVLANQLKQLPEISEVVDAEGLTGLIPIKEGYSTFIHKWDEQPAGSKEIHVERLFVSPEYVDFYNFQLLEGEKLNDADPETFVLISESLVKALGWQNPVGKRFGYDDRGGGYTVKGVIKNIYHLAPTVQTNPFFYKKRSPNETMRGDDYTTVLFKCREGMWKSCRAKIEQLLKKEYADLSYVTLINTEEAYNKFLQSEDALIKLLSFVAMICVLICVFGFVSLVSLTCQERRKQIAIRKINGATVSDILAIFTKEYFLLLFIGAVIAFTAGYFIMQRWLENYVKQTSIPAWVYLSILIAMALVIVACVGWRVYRASVENPAKVMKME
jgi:cell division protein FtsX